MSLLKLVRLQKCLLQGLWGILGRVLRAVTSLACVSQSGGVKIIAGKTWLSCPVPFWPRLAERDTRGLQGTQESPAPHQHQNQHTNTYRVVLSSPPAYHSLIRKADLDALRNTLKSQTTSRPPDKTPIFSRTILNFQINNKKTVVNWALMRS